MNISVIIPVYNAEKYIEKAIKSCIQLSEVKEIIVVDDGYRDRAKEIVIELIKEFPIVKLFEHPDNENKGTGLSRNLGIEKATQEYIAFLDADDFFLPNRFEMDKCVIENYPDVDGCYNAIDCHFYTDTAKNLFLKKFNSTRTTVNSFANPTPKNLFRGLLGLIPNYGYFSLDGLTIKKELLINNKILFPDSSMHEDTVFAIKLAYYGKLYPSEINEPVALRGVHEENRITANYELEKKIQFEKRFLMWNSIYEWSKNLNLEKKEILFLKQQASLFKLLSNKNPRFKDMIKLIPNNYRVILNRDFRQLLLNFFN
ncbi:MAG: glycosyltransferase family 2 protein [Clostridia bacterium]|nr:glycosyltransferase family 2 protein [Tissierellia bacterium]MDD4376475.1 glycosyltransferase family 2 protein [Clostridia bacterium]